MRTLRLDQSRALITGGASGIGAGAARRLSAEGTSVVIADIDDQAGGQLAAQIGAEFVHLDVADSTQWEQVVAARGPFDIGFLNAGIATAETRPPGSLPVLSLTDDTYRRAMSINVDGVVFGTRALLPAMIEQGHGDLVITASMAGLIPISLDPVYGLTKHAVVGFTRSMAAAIAEHPGHPDICISSICPGFTDTNIITADVKSMISGAGLEIMTTEHVADVVVRALTERVQGAQWVIWPDRPVDTYQWASVLGGIMTAGSSSPGSS
jgi:NAD(P)-dependent dehydrogenase (short-subunit alcohol dehydrogenase family)